MKHILNKTLLAIAATATLLLSGCTKDNTEQGASRFPATGGTVTRGGLK